jgi:phosphoesterase RecJ-like protein
MNYFESQSILEHVVKANNILINCHRGPDQDSVGSATALYQVIAKMNKKVTMICPDKIPGDCQFIPLADKVQTVDYKWFDFSPYDLFLIIDTGDLYQLDRSPDLKLPAIKKIVIDHHITNTRFGDINLVDGSTTSAAEVVYRMLKDWNVEVDTQIAQCLMAGMVGDTGAFSYPMANSQTFQAAKELMDKGADKDTAVLNIYRNIEYKKMLLWGEMIRNMQIDTENKFVWTTVSKADYAKYNLTEAEKENAKSSFAGMFICIVKDTDFGFVASEEGEKMTSVSFRSRTGWDVSLLATALKGGGHRYASGAVVYDLPFNEAVSKILETARKLCHENKS